MKKKKIGTDSGRLDSTGTKTVEKKAISETIGSPEDVLAAAEFAAPVFHIARYYRSVRLMREKGYSWREISNWLKQFRIEISYVHLRRLFVEENERLATLEEVQLRELGMHPDNIRETLEKSDPVDRLPAPDPEDADQGTDP